MASDTLDDNGNTAWLVAGPGRASRRRVAVSGEFSGGTVTLQVSRNGTDNPIAEGVFSATADKVGVIEVFPREYVRGVLAGAGGSPVPDVTVEISD